MTHDKIEAAVPLYAAGALERVERQALETHLLSGCIPCHTTLKKYQSVAATLPFVLNITPPPRALKGKIMSPRLSPAAAESEPQPPSRPSLEPGEWMNHLFPPSSPSTPSFGWALGMVILVVLIVLAFFGWTSSTQTAEDMEKLAQLQSQAAEMGSTLTILRQQLGEHEESLTKTREELQQRLAELAELRDQLIQREAEVDDLKAQLARRDGRSAPTP
jgi:hypothetical protein